MAYELGDSKFDVAIGYNTYAGANDNKTKTISVINYDRAGEAASQPSAYGVNADILNEFARDVAVSIIGGQFDNVSLIDRRPVEDGGD